MIWPIARSSRTDDTIARYTEQLGRRALANAGIADMQQIIQACTARGFLFDFESHPEIRDHIFDRLLAGDDVETAVVAAITEDQERTPF